MISDEGEELGACSVGTVPFRSATVSTVKRGFIPFRNGRKRAIRMGERTGTVPTVSENKSAIRKNELSNSICLILAWTKVHQISRRIL